MYTRSYGSRPSITSRPLPPDYGGTALVIPQHEGESLSPHHPDSPILSPSSVSRPPQPPSEAPPTPPSSAPLPPPAPPMMRPPRASRPHFSGRRNRPITAPSMPTPPDYDSRRFEEAPPSPANRRDPLGAPPFGGLGIPPLQGLEGLLGAVSSGHPDCEPPEETSSATETSAGLPAHPLLPFTALALRQDDLLLLGLLLFLLHEQDEGDTDCRDALLLLAALFVAGM